MRVNLEPKSRAEFALKIESFTRACAARSIASSVESYPAMWVQSLEPIDRQVHDVYVDTNWSFIIGGQECKSIPRAVKAVQALVASHGMARCAITEEEHVASLYDTYRETQRRSLTLLIAKVDVYRMNHFPETGDVQAWIAETRGALEGMSVDHRGALMGLMLAVIRPGFTFDAEAFMEEM